MRELIAWAFMYSLDGRLADEGVAGALPTANHPFTGVMNAANRVVFSLTLKTTERANTAVFAERCHTRQRGTVPGQRPSATADRATARERRSRRERAAGGRR